MPYKPLKPCRQPGCRELTSSGYCDKHKRQEEQRYNKQERGSAVYRRYNGRWRKISKAYLRDNPLCEICKREGRLTAAAMVHHKVKITDGGTNSRDNLQALCARCHSRLHAERGDYFTGGGAG